MNNRKLVAACVILGLICATLAIKNFTGPQAEHNVTQRERPETIRVSSSKAPMVNSSGTVRLGSQEKTTKNTPDEKPEEDQVSGEESNDQGNRGRKRRRKSGKPSDPICTNQNLMRVMAEIRRVCLNGNCSIEQFVKRAQNLDIKKFIAAVELIDQKTVFFFKKGTSTIDEDQQAEKVTSLVSQVSYQVADPENTALFIIGKASHTGSQSTNRRLSAERTEAAYKMLAMAMVSEKNGNSFTEESYKQLTTEEKDKLLVEAGDSFQCHTVYRTYVSNQVGFSHYAAKKSNYINDEDIEHASKVGEKLKEYTNQSVVLLNYPCFSEMCDYMRDELGLKCNQSLDPQQRIPEECWEQVCEG